MLVLDVPIRVLDAEGMPRELASEKSLEGESSFVFSPRFVAPTQHKELHILIADDHAQIRRGLKDILTDFFPDAHFSEARDGDEVFDRLAERDFGVVTLDLNMPGRNGMDVLQDVKAGYPSLPVIVVSVQPEELYAGRCMRAGASAYVNKDSVSESLGEAVRKIVSGKGFGTEGG